jgi:uroporphyrinogen decarboxylase
MLPRERVIAVIEHRKPDRIPVYGWVRANLEKQITAAFGSVEAFEDKYEFDFAHIFGGPGCYDRETLKALGARVGGAIEPAHLLEAPMCDPNASAAYDGVRKAVEHHKTQRGRFVYVQTPGIFECLNGPFGIENHLMYLGLYPEELKRCYARQAEWNRQFAMNCLDLGVDMVHVSDDWGAQNSLMFSPATWWEMIYPYHKVVCDAVKARKAFVSLHSDGNVNAVLDGIVKLGYDVVHPYQESAGMDLAGYKRDYSGRFVVMGGLDVQTTIGFGDYDRLRREIDRLLDMFREGGLLFCTTHFVQDHCTIEELTFAFDYIHKGVRRRAAK